MIAIIDYGVGNLLSVEKAFEFIGVTARVTSDKDEILSAQGVVLPGVGAFSDAMAQLKRDGLDLVVKQVAAQNKPLLGICLGQQLLFDYSEEGGTNEGLGIIKGKVVRFPADMGLKVPHMGWNALQFPQKSKLFRGLPLNPYVYFVHSYYCVADNRDEVIATVNYGVTADAAVCRGNIYATQFHPEKSGTLGLDILRNFSAVVKEEK
ncbi:MAG: imidazole glycerol phosphate synthase subunit HisH [Hyphomonadaceae bacterium]|nr:imidazole glycerol phosphate synthase subunit HisH [Clostridia bacterium]